MIIGDKVYLSGKSEYYRDENKHFPGQILRKIAGGYRVSFSDGTTLRYKKYDLLSVNQYYYQKRKHNHMCDKIKKPLHRLRLKK